jgi:hypothetical protein
MPLLSIVFTPLIKAAQEVEIGRMARLIKKVSKTPS